MRDFARELVLPLIVTLLLQHDGHYQLSEDDEARCQAVDKLLAVAEWDEEDDDGGPARWQTTPTETRRLPNSEEASFSGSSIIFSVPVEGL